MNKALATTAVTIVLCMTLTSCADASFSLPIGKAQSSIEIETSAANAGEEHTIYLEEEIEEEGNPFDIKISGEEGYKNTNQTEEAFINPESNIGVVLDLEMKIYGTPAYENGILCFNAHLLGAEEMAAYINIPDEAQLMDLTDGDEIKIVGILADTRTCKDKYETERPMPLIAATNVECVTEKEPEETPAVKEGADAANEPAVTNPAETPAEQATTEAAPAETAPTEPIE